MPTREHTVRAVLRAGAICFLTTLIVVLAGTFSTVALRSPHTQGDDNSFVRFTNGDGVWYGSITRHGYQHSSATFSDTAFFPIFPYCARWLARVTWLPAEAALVVVANLCLAASFVAAAVYTAARYPQSCADITDYTLLSLGLLPATFFFRMAYAESMFLLLTLLLLYGLARRWSLLVLAFIVGLATATRPVGVALLPVFALSAWRRCAPSSDVQISRIATSAWRLTRVALLILIAFWGLAAYVVFQWIQFGDPLAFAKSQLDCRLIHAPDISWPRKLLGAAILEPVWATYIPSMPEYWGKYELYGSPLISLQFANPIYFIGTAILVVVGWRKKWLNEYELLLSAGLLLIPYVLKSHDNAMAGFGRFAAVVFPVYPVIGHLLHRLGGPLSAILLAISTFFLVVYTALFTAHYRLL